MMSLDMVSWSYGASGDRTSKEQYSVGAVVARQQSSGPEKEVRGLEPESRVQEQPLSQGGRKDFDWGFELESKII
eukprot:1217328-Rhodomonas_salina.3